VVRATARITALAYVRFGSTVSAGFRHSSVHRGLELVGHHLRGRLLCLGLESTADHAGVAAHQGIEALTGDRARIRALRLLCRVARTLADEQVCELVQFVRQLALGNQSDVFE
jgi:hypothetical protein